MATLNDLVIRKARRSDVDVLVRFSANMAWETEQRRLDRRRLRRGTEAVLRKPARGFYLVAELPERASRSVVGQLLITYEWSDWRNATFWWIQSVYVDSAWRRRGVYRRMHEAVLELARQEGDVCGVRLYVEGENAVAKTAYTRVGLDTSSYHVFENDFVLRRTGDRVRKKRQPEATR